MKSAWARNAGILLALLILAYAPAMALEKLQDGVYAIDPAIPDELLELDKVEDLRVLIMDTMKSKTISEAHTQSLRKWVEGGGVLWVSGEAVKSPPLAMVNKGIKFTEFDYQKATTGKKGGELVARGVSENLEIHDHALTKGVNKLYVYPAFKFDGSTDLQPLVEMTDKNGEHGVVLGAIPLGRGYIVLDGSKQSAGMAFWRGDELKDKPHAVKTSEGTWEDYDWEKLLENAKSVKVTATAPRT